MVESDIREEDKKTMKAREAIIYSSFFNYRASQRSRGSPASLASPADFASREFCAS